MIVYCRFRQYLALQPAERTLLLRAFISLAVMQVLLRVAGYQRAVRWARRTELGHYRGADALGRARELAFWIAVASQHHFVSAHCLQCSLVLYQWLWQEGLPSDLRIGVRKVRGEIRAHAWVEYQGQVVNDQETAVSRFVPLTSPGAVPSSSAAVSAQQRRERSPGDEMSGVQWS
jgi:hypothetical protein